MRTIVAPLTELAGTHVQGAAAEVFGSIYAVGTQAVVLPVRGSCSKLAALMGVTIMIDAYCFMLGLREEC